MAKAKKNAKKRVITKKKARKTAIKGRGTNVNENFDKNGKFAEGNKAAEGHSNTAHHRSMQFKKVYQQAVTNADMKAIAKAVAKKAKKGDIKAAKEVCDRCMGKAEQPIRVDATLDVKHPEPITIEQAQQLLDDLKVAGTGLDTGLSNGNNNGV